ncbi:hypothetical protein ACUXQ2_005746 [Cupriavidus metallidurans]
MKSINKVILASVVLATLGVTSGAAMAVQKVDPFRDGAHVADARSPFTNGGRSVTDPRDPFSDGARGASGRPRSEPLAAGPRQPDPFTDGSHGLASSGATTA